MQYYLELQPEIAGVFFESSAFAEASDRLEQIARQLELPSHFELFSYASQNDLCPPEYQEIDTPWFETQRGIDWLVAMSQQIRSDPDAVPNSAKLLNDFSECEAVLRQAKAAGAKWHFAMDI